MSHRFFQNKKCEYFPCHKVKENDKFNCLFCYCPLYWLKDCGGNYNYLSNNVKDCSNCLIPHGINSWKIINDRLTKEFNKIINGKSEDKSV